MLNEATATHTGRGSGRLTWASPLGGRALIHTRDDEGP